MGAKLIQVIETDNTRLGNGKTTPIRAVREFYTTDGELLAVGIEETEERVRQAVAQAESAGAARGRNVAREDIVRIFERFPNQGAMLDEILSAFDGLERLCGVFERPPRLC
jgi:hypothetical protein